MGTAGPLRLASDILDDGSGDPFFVLNRCCFWLHLVMLVHVPVQEQVARPLEQELLLVHACVWSVFVCK